MTKSCSDCSHLRQASNAPTGSGYCTRYPPSVHQGVNALGQMAYQSRFPTVGPAEYCGEHRANVLAIAKRMKR